MTTQDFFAAMDADPADRSVFFALADYLEECGLLEESQAWRLIAQSDREPMPPDEYTKGKWWWRDGCSCDPTDILFSSECTDSNPGSNHPTRKYVLHKLCPLPTSNQPHPHFGIHTDVFYSSRYANGSIHASASRSEAFQKLAKRIMIFCKLGVIP